MNIPGLIFLSFLCLTSAVPLKKHRSARDIDDDFLKETNVVCEINNRYARTTIKNVYYNDGDDFEEIDFDVALPITGFITEFTIEVDNKEYKSEITTNERANEIYDLGKENQLTVGKVEYSKFRDSKAVSMPINLPPQKNVSVYLKYDELVTFYFDTYYWSANIYMSEFVPVFTMNIYIKELVDIKNIKMISQNVEDVRKTYPIDPKYVTSYTEGNIGFVSFEVPKSELTKSMASINNIFMKPSGATDIQAKFYITYQLEKTSPGGDVFIDEEGNYVHRFPAPLVQALSKHIVFVLDTSYSMYYQKINQLKTAMEKMIDQLSPNDYFSIITYDSIVKVWDLDKKIPKLMTHRVHGRKKSGITTAMINSLPKPYPATENYKLNAKKLIFSLSPSGATNIYDSLKLAYLLAKNTKSYENNVHTEPIVVYLTDGAATVGERNKKNIINMTKNMNKDSKKINLYTVGFGRDAEIKFLKEIARENFGHERYIYEANDASQQMTNFYETISTPVISNVKFNHPERYEDQSTPYQYNLINQGEELISSGRVKRTSNEITADDFKVEGIGADEDLHLSPAIRRVFRSVKNEENIGGMEKYRAFIQLQDLISQVKSQDDPIIKQIVDISIKYRFVTPYTSLVVLVPPEDEATKEFLRTVLKPFPIELRRKTVHRNRVNNIFKSPITTLPWLSLVLDGDEKISINNQTYEIGDDNTKLQTKDTVECDVPKLGESGSCTLMRDCPGVHPKIKDFDTYIHYFCPLENDKYAGVCCVLENDDEDEDE